MSLLAFIHGPMMSIEELKQTCLKTCSEAYVTTNASACAFGCQGQLPVVEERRNNLMQFRTDLERDLERNAIFEVISQRIQQSASEVINAYRGLREQVSNIRWVSISSYVNDNGDKVVVVVDGPAQVQLQAQAELVSSNVKVSDVKATLRTEYTIDPFSVISNKTGIDKQTLWMSLFGIISMLTLIYFYMALSCSSKIHEQGDQGKLSIYGDLEYLPMYDEGQPEYMNEKKMNLGGYEAPPLPLKTAII